MIETTTAKAAINPAKMITTSNIDKRETRANIENPTGRLA
jgi:hypothetical protein